MVDEVELVKQEDVEMKKKGKWMQRRRGERPKRKRLEMVWLYDVFQLHLIDLFQ